MCVCGGGGGELKRYTEKEGEEDEIGINIIINGGGPFDTHQEEAHSRVLSNLEKSLLKMSIMNVRDLEE